MTLTCGVKEESKLQVLANSSRVARGHLNLWVNSPNLHMRHWSGTGYDLTRAGGGRPEQQQQQQLLLQQHWLNVNSTGGNGPHSQNLVNQIHKYEDWFCESVKTEKKIMTERELAHWSYM